MSEHFGNDALRQETNAGKADMHILHSLPAALIRRGNIDPVHKIMQHSGRQFLQVGIFLRPEDELLNAVGFFLLLGNLLFQKLHFLRQLCLLIFIVGGQLFKSAIIAFLESTDFEDALRTAVSLGGDSDTPAAITGSIVEAFYGVPEELRHECRKHLTPELAAILRLWESALYNEKNLW